MLILFLRLIIQILFFLKLNNITIDKFNTYKLVINIKII